MLKEGGAKNIHIASEILATNVAEK
jgi:hypothetical protein